MTQTQTPIGNVNGLVAVSNGNIREMLVAERRDLISEITAHALNGNGESPGVDDTDYAAMSQLRDIEFTRREALNSRLHRVDEALGRIATGSYGVCDECGTRIAEKRLAADPAASLCLRCQAASETGIASNSL